MRIPVLAMFLGLLIGSVLVQGGLAGTRQWDSATLQRAETAAYQDSDILAIADGRFGSDNDIVGTVLTDLGAVPGGREYEIRYIVEPEGSVFGLPDFLVTVFVSDDLSDSYVVDYTDPAPTSHPNPGGGEVNNSVEWRAAAEAFGDSGVRVELDARFDADVIFTDYDAVVIGSDESGTTVEVTMFSDSEEPGEGDVIATVLVGETSAIVTNVEGL